MRCLTVGRASPAAVVRAFVLPHASQTAPCASAVVAAFLSKSGDVDQPWDVEISSMRRCLSDEPERTKGGLKSIDAILYKINISREETRREGN